MKGESKIAHEYYSRAYDRMIKIEPPHWKEAAYILNKIGIFLFNQGKFNEALISYQRALTIEEKFLSSDHVDNARILNNIALIRNIQGNNREALDL